MKESIQPPNDYCKRMKVWFPDDLVWVECFIWVEDHKVKIVKIQ